MWIWPFLPFRSLWWWHWEDSLWNISLLCVDAKFITSETWTPYFPTTFSTCTMCQTCELVKLLSLDMTFALGLSQMASGESANLSRGILCIWISPPLSSLQRMRHLQPWGFLSPLIWGTFHIHRPHFFTSATNFSFLDTMGSFRLWCVLTHGLRSTSPCNRRSEWVLPPLCESGPWRCPH